GAGVRGFFLQAEDGIRDWSVTGVQTCALPISFANVAVYTSGAANLTGGQEPERVVTAAVSPNMFATLGVPALAGRVFDASDDARSEERRVAGEGRGKRWRGHREEEATARGDRA